MIVKSDIGSYGLKQDYSALREKIHAEIRLLENSITEDLTEEHIECVEKNIIRLGHMLDNVYQTITSYKDII